MSPSPPEIASAFSDASRPHRFVLGIDPGLAATGFAVLGGPSLDRLTVRKQGTIRTPSTESLSRRIGTIFELLEGIAGAFPLSGIAVEDHFSRRASPGAGLMLGPVVGVVALLADRSRLPLLAIPPRELKHRITGSGGASKETVQRSLSVWLGQGLRISSTHEGDALGLAFLGFNRLDRT